MATMMTGKTQKTCMFLELELRAEEEVLENQHDDYNNNPFILPAYEWISGNTN